MSSDRARRHVPFEPHPAVVVGVGLRTAAIVVVLSLVLGAVIMPGVSDVLAAMSPGTATGILVLVSSAIRAAAGMFGARLLRRRYGTTGRAEALASVAVGVVAAWALYVGLVALAGGSDGPWWRLLLELPRWVLEAGLGAALVTPGEAEAADPALTRFAGVRRRDTGAASLEYAGIMFVVVLVVGSVVGSITPVGAAIKAKICQALGASCGGSASAAEQRAKDLKVTCTQSKRDRDLGYNLVVEGVRGQRKDADGITKYGDGSATVVVSQGGGLGLDGGSSAKGFPAGYTLQGTVSGDVGYVYRFPQQYGGPDAAQDFVDDRRSGWQQAAQIAVPGLQSVEEGGSRAMDAVSNWWDDDVVPFFGGDGPSAQELAEREVEQRKATADAIQVSVSLQGQVGVQVGAGVKQPTGGTTPGGKPEMGPAGGPVRLDGKVSAEVKGSATIGLDTGQPDSVASSFTGSAKIDAEGTAIVGAGMSGSLPFLAFKGSAGASGSYTVSYDADGNPTKLVVTTETKAGWGGGVQTPGGFKAGGKDLSQNVTANEETRILDLNTSTPEGRANREAFDRFFVTTGFSVDGKQARMSVPAIASPVVTVATGRDPIKDTAALVDRLNNDAFVVRSTYTDVKDEGGMDAKVAGWGVGGSMNSNTRTLVSATGYDQRNGGQQVNLANCPG